MNETWKIHSINISQMVVARKYPTLQWNVEQENKKFLGGMVYKLLWSIEVKKIFLYLWRKNAYASCKDYWTGQTLSQIFIEFHETVRKIENHDNDTHKKEYLLFLLMSLSCIKNCIG